MTKSLSNTLTLTLAFVGCVVAMLLTVEHNNPTALPGCTKAGEGCAATLSSAYGHIGPVPTAALGLLMYVAFVVLCVARGKQLRLAREREAHRAAAYAASGVMEVVPDTAASEIENGTSSFAGSSSRLESETSITPPPPSGLSVRHLDLAVWGMALIGFGISFWLQYVAIYQIQYFCKYCFTSAIVVTLIFALSSRDFLLDGRQLTGEQKMLGGVLALIGILGSFLVIPDIIAVMNRPTPIIETPTIIDKPDARQQITNSVLHQKGNPKAPIQLIEFADYQCKHCALAAPELEAAMKMFPKDIRIAFRNFPLPMHPNASLAAAAAEAAGEQGKFWEMHDLLFQKQSEFDKPAAGSETFSAFATQLHLDVARFDRDRTSDSIRARVAKDMAAGEAGDVQSTPTFFFVSPSHVTRVAGIEELKKFLAKGHTKDWD